MMICAIHRQEPNWPATTERPRFVFEASSLQRAGLDHNGIARYWVETDGPEPTVEEVLDVLHPATSAPDVIVPYREFRLRWTDAEREALFTVERTDWRVRDFVTQAAADGSVNLNGKEAAEAKEYFVNTGILARDRSDAIFGGAK